MIAAVILDLDGVLFDSEAAYRRAFRDTLGCFGLTIGDDRYGSLIGVATPERLPLLRAWWPGLPVAAFAAEYRVRKSATIDSGIALKPGARAVLDRLAAHAIPVAVATSASRRTAHRLLHASPLAIDHLATRDDVARGKPDPGVYLAAAAGLGVAAASCWAVEDSAPGLLAARRAGMTPMLAPDLVRPDRRMRALAHAVVPDLLALVPLLRLPVQPRPFLPVRSFVTRGV